MHEVLSIGMGWFIIAISDLSKQRKRSTLSDHVTYVLNLGALCVVETACHLIYCWSRW
jgi:hypothetical protein